MRTVLHRFSPCSFLDPNSWSKKRSPPDSSSGVATVSIHSRRGAGAMARPSRHGRSRGGGESTHKVDVASGRAQGSVAESRFLEVVMFDQIWSEAGSRTERDT